MLLFLLGCRPVDPAQNALVACKAMPALELDAAGQAYARDAVDEAELRRWRSIVEYNGPMSDFGPPGFGVIRANSTCELRSVGPTEVVAVRTEPAIATLDPFDPEKVWEAPTVTVQLRFAVLPDGRVRVGLDQAWTEAEAARALPVSERAVALEQLHGWFPDPMLILEAREAREQARPVQTIEAIEVEGIPRGLPVESPLAGLPGGGK